MSVFRFFSLNFSDDECQRVKNSLKMIENVNRRINTDLKTVREKLSEIELIKEVDERNKNAKTLKANVGLMINGMAEELISIATTFKLKDEPGSTETDSLLVRASTSKQPDPNAASKSRRIYDSDSDGSVRSPNAQKKLRRRQKHRSNDNIFTSDSDSSYISMSTTLSERQLAIKNEPTVHSQAIEDLMNGRSNEHVSKEHNVRAPSADSSKDADNDDELMGFAEGSSEIEIGIKTELLQTLESEPTINGMPSESATSNDTAKQNESRNGSIDVTKECDNLQPIDKSAIVNGNGNKDKKSSDIDDGMSSNEDELLSAQNGPNSVSDEDDADIRK